MTLLYASNFSEGVATTNGSGLYTQVQGTPVWSRTGGRSSGSYIQLTFSNSVIRLGGNPSSGEATASLYFKFTTLPSGNATPINFFYFSDGVDTYNINFDVTNNRFTARLGSTTQWTLTSSLVPQANIWYRLDVHAVANTDPHTMDWQITEDGGITYFGNQVTYSAAATTLSQWRIGTSFTSGAFVCQYTDLVITDSASDYPIGDHDTLLLYPASDGANNPGTNTMEDQAGTDIGVTTAYDKINSLSTGSPSSTTYVRQATADTSAYIECNLSGGIPSDAKPIGLYGFLAYTSATTSTNQCAVGTWDGSNYYAIFGTPSSRADFSDGSTSNLYYKSANQAIPLSVATMNSLKIRGGYSNDATPNPYIIDVWCIAVFKRQTQNKVVSFNQSVKRANI